LGSEEGTWLWLQPTQATPRFTKCNSPLINGNEPMTILLYNGPLLCGFNVPIKGLMMLSNWHTLLTGRLGWLQLMQLAR